MSQFEFPAYSAGGRLVGRMPYDGAMPEPTPDPDPRSSWRKFWGLAVTVAITLLLLQMVR